MQNISLLYLYVPNARTTTFYNTFYLFTVYTSRGELSPPGLQSECLHAQNSRNRSCGSILAVTKNLSFFLTKPGCGLGRNFSFGGNFGGWSRRIQCIKGRGRKAGFGLYPAMILPSLFLFFSEVLLRTVVE